MKLYYLPGACSLADHIVLEWIGKPYETKQVARDELRSPEYLKINPHGVVPALEHDGWVLTENVAILGYLAECFPDAKLGGEGPRGHAEVHRWLAFINSDVHQCFKPVFAPARFLNDPAQHDELQTHARNKLRNHFEQLDKQLVGRDWLTGTRSIADPYLFVVLNWAKGKNVDLSGFEQLARFHQRMLEDTGVKAAMKAEGLS